MNNIEPIMCGYVSKSYSRRGKGGINPVWTPMYHIQYQSYHALFWRISRAFRKALSIAYKPGYVAWIIL